MSLTDAERHVMTLTDWGEARGEPVLGQIAVAWVLRNRYDTHYRGKQNMVDVCKDPYQFSCWLQSDPNRSKMLMLSQDDLVYISLRRICMGVMDGTIDNPIGASRHYYAVGTLEPAWAIGHSPYRQIEHHLFFEGIA